MKFISSYGVAFVLIAIVAGWLATGTFIQGGKGPGEGEKPIVELLLGDDGETAADNPENADEPEEEAKLLSVRTVLFNARQMPVEVSLRGRTKASATISVSAETNGLIEEIHVVKGQSVVAGDLICTLDQGVRNIQVTQAKASLVQAEASLIQAQADFETNKSLREKGLSAANTGRSFEVQLQAAKSSVAAALSALDSAKLELARTQIHAEVSGIIQDPLANVGDMMGGGAVCATLVQLDPMLFVGKVVEAKVGLLREGMAAKVTTVTGQMVEGTVIFIAAIADDATRSFTVEIEIANPKGKIRSGLTADADIEVGITEAHLVPQSSLTLDSDGAIGIKIVVDEVVKFLPVTPIRDSKEGIWIAGLPASAEIIIFGQEYVVDGQKVAATRVEPGDAS